VVSESEVELKVEFEPEVEDALGPELVEAEVDSGRLDLVLVLVPVVEGLDGASMGTPALLLSSSAKAAVASIPQRACVAATDVARMKRMVGASPISPPG
jgi:hypothetical protein